MTNNVQAMRLRLVWLFLGLGLVTTCRSAGKAVSTEVEINWPDAGVELSSAPPPARRDAGASPGADSGTMDVP